MPGYTHLQVAMPSSFGLWFGAYAESLTDDMQLVTAAYKITNQNHRLEHHASQKESRCLRDHAR